MTVNKKSLAYLRQIAADDVANGVHDAAPLTPKAILALLDHIDALQADAERYRWLGDRQPGGAFRIAGVIYSDGGAGVDAAVDAAMSEAGR